MFCPQCGSQNVDNAKFCKSCGAPLTNFNRGPVAQSGAAPTPYAASAAGAAMYGAPTPQRKSHRGLFIILGLVVVAAIVVLILFLTGVFGGGASKPLPNIPEGTYGLSDYYKVEVSDDGEVVFMNTSDEPYLSVELSPEETFEGSTLYRGTGKDLNDSSNELELLAVVPNSAKSQELVGIWALQMIDSDDDDTYTEFAVANEDGDAMLGYIDHCPTFTDDPEFWKEFFDSSAEDIDDMGGFITECTWTKQGSGEYTLRLKGNSSSSSSSTAKVLIAQ